jgi:hypothetical protein
MSVAGPLNSNSCFQPHTGEQKTRERLLMMMFFLVLSSVAAFLRSFLALVRGQRAHMLHLLATGQISWRLKFN